MCIFETWGSSRKAYGVFIGNDKSYGMVISSKGVWWCRNGDPWSGSGADKQARIDGMYRLAEGPKDYQGGVFYLRSITKDGRL